MKHRGRLAGKVAMVTGASRGIGRAIAFELAGEGAALILAARSEPDLEAVAATIDSAGGQAIVAPCDVRRAAEVKAAVSGALAEWGRLDILVNNAGVAFNIPLAQMPEADFDLTIDVNLKGAFLCCREAVPVMARQRSGVIVNISSGAGKRGIAGLAAYSASKFGLIGLTEALAGELEADAVRVYALCPGGVETGMWHSLFGDQPAALMPEHVARRTLELCLPDNPTPTGSSIEVREPFDLEAE